MSSVFEVGSLSYPFIVKMPHLPEIINNASGYFRPVVSYFISLVRQYFKYCNFIMKHKKTLSVLFVKIVM